MNIIYGTLNGLSHIWAHKVRSFLTMLGIVLGVATLVFVMGLVQGMFTSWTQQLVQSGGLEKITIRPATPPAKQRALAGTSPGQTLKDGYVIRKLCPLAACISPEASLAESTAQHGGKTYRTVTKGVVRDIFDINKLDVLYGRYLGDIDVERYSQVAVIGSAVAKELFGKPEDALGQKIIIQGLPLTVVGVLKYYELLSGNYNLMGAKNRSVLIPITTMQIRLTGNKILTGMNVKVTQMEYLHDLVEQLKKILTQTHRGIQDFRVDTKERSLAEIAQYKKTYNITLGGIAIVSLFVGGIGILNVMLASINERIREIGVRKAVGAKNRDIFFQFLAEAVTLSFLGGLVGLLVSLGVISLWQKLASKSEFGFGGAPEISAQSVLIGLGFSIVVGILAGIYPALRAARLNPITSLRYE